MMERHPEVAALQFEPGFHNSDPTRQWIQVAATCLNVDGSEYEIDNGQILGIYEVAVTSLVKENSIPGSASPSYAYIRPRRFAAHDHDHVLILNTNDAEVPGEVTVKEAMVDAPQAEGEVQCVQLWNTSPEAKVVTEGQVIALMVRPPAVAFDAHDDNLNQTVDLYENLKAAAAEVHSATARISTDIAAMEDQVPSHPIDESRRALLQAASPADIRAMLEQKRVSEEDVLDSIIPLVTIDDGFGSGASGCSNQVMDDGRMVKHFLAVQPDEALLSAFRLNSDTPAVGRAEFGDTLQQAHDAIAAHVPVCLRPALWLYALQPQIHGHGVHIDASAAVRHHAFIASLTARLSPVAIYTLDTSPFIKEVLDLSEAFTRTVDLSSVGLPQRRTRVIVSNIDLAQWRIDNTRTTPADVLSVDKDWKIYDARGRAKPVTDPAPVVHRLGLSAGKNVKSAKQLSVTSLAKLQQIDNFQLPPEWGNLYRIRAVAEASPPCMGKLLARTIARNVTVVNTIASVLQYRTAVDKRQFDQMLLDVTEGFDQATHLLRVAALSDMADSPPTLNRPKPSQTTTAPDDRMDVSDDRQVALDLMEVSEDTTNRVIDFHARGGEMEFRQPDRPSVHLTRDQVLGQDEGFLEGCHNFIQVLFPLNVPSSHVDDAPVLTQDQILQIPAESLRACLATMQSFFQYKHESGGWTQHNNLRVSRILKCLVLRGLLQEASGFYHFMAHLREGHADSIRRWREATEAALRQVPSAQQVAASTQKAGEDTADEIIYVHGRKTKQDLEDQLKANAKKEAEYRPDYSDMILPSVEEIEAAFVENGMQKRVEQGTLPGGQDTLTKFEDMFISAYAVADHILRVAGPTRVSIRATRTVRVRPYPLRDKERFEACKLIIEDLLQRGVVKRCTSSPFRSPALVVSKKAKPGAPLQARYRFVSDYRQLNRCTISDGYIPPPTDFVIGQIANCKIVSFIDQTKAFWQLALSDSDGSQDATAFTLPGIGSFKFTRLVMGLQQATAAFQSHIERVLDAALLDYCAAYVDDVCCYSQSIEQHIEHLQFIMLRMLSAGCSINLAKSQFCLDANEGHEFLGVHVTGSGIRPSPRLVQGIVDMAVPKTLKDVRSCVGALNFHRRFIPAFAEKVHSLNKAICRGDDFKGLTPAEIADFERLRAELKDIVQRKQQLYFVDLSKEIEVLTDASKNGLGAFCFQRVGNEIHPIAYLSRSVTAAEAKYHDLCMGTAGGSETRQLELLGVVWALDALQNILTGCPRVVLSTDHRNIRHMLVEAQKLHTGVQNDRLLRWALKLSSYPNVDIQYRPGIRNEVADCLSRLQDNPSAAAVLDGPDFLLVEELPFGLADEMEFPMRAAGDTDRRRYKVRISQAVSATEQFQDVEDVRTCADGISGFDVHAVAATTTGEAQQALPATPPPDVPEEPLTEHHPPPTVEEIRECQRADVKIKHLVDQLKKGGGAAQDLRDDPRKPRSEVTKNGYFLGDHDLLYRQAGTYKREGLPPEVINFTALVISTNDAAEELRTKIIRNCHSGLFAAHMGRHATLHRVSQRYTWRGMEDEVRSFVRACLHCRRSKAPTTGRNGFLDSYQIDGCFETIAIDVLEFKGNQSKGPHGENALLICYDLFSHFLVVVPLVERTMKAVASAILYKVCLPYGCPVRVVADNAFSNQEFKALTDLLGIQCRYVSAHGSKSNPAERFCGLIKTMLRTFVDQFPKKYADARYYGHAFSALPFCVASYNNSIIYDTTITPFQLVHGRSYRWPHDLQFIDDPGLVLTRTSLEKYYRDRQVQYRSITEWMHPIVREVQAKNAQRYNAHQKVLTLQPKDLVLVHVPTRAGKLATNHIGPAEVIDAVDDSQLLYRVRFPNSNHSPIVHVRRLTKYYPRPGEADTALKRRLILEDAADSRGNGTSQGTATGGGDPMDADLSVADMQPGHNVIVRGNGTQHYYTARVVDVYADTDELSIHYYAHQQTRGGKGLEYNPLLPLDKRKLLPEYSYYNRREKRERRDRTLTPSANYEPFVNTVRIGDGKDQFSLVYGNFQLTSSNSISARDITALKSIAPQAFTAT